MPPCRGCARCHHPSYFQPTWWSHNPQVHWIETWLFFTTRILMYPLHLASYVIHELNAIPLFILESNTMLFSLFKPPFQLLSSHWMIAYPFETLVPSYIAHNEFTEIQLVGYLVYFPLSHRQMPSFVEMRSSGVFPLGRVRRTMEIPKKGWRLDHGDLKQRNEDINERDQPLWKGQPRPRRLVRFFATSTCPPLLHRLNLGTRFLIVEENCDARIINLQ